MPALKPRRSATLSPNWHPARRQFVKYVGTYTSADGSVRPKLHLLGDDPLKAVIRLADITRQWSEVRRQGHKCWPPSWPCKSEAAVTVVTPPAATVASTPAARPDCDPPPPPLPTVTVRAAVREYIAYLARQQEGGQFTRRHVTSQEQRVRRATAPLDELTLAELNERRVQEAVLRLCQRPAYDSKCRHGGEGDRLSVNYAKSCINSFKWFLLWVEESDDYRWTRPRRFARIFKSRPVLTSEEQANVLDTADAEPDCATLEELKALYANATSLQRCLLLLSWNCAFCTAECATLLRSEIKELDGENPRIERLRRKLIRFGPNAAYARYHLWPETVALLRQHMASPNAAGLALLNGSGNPLTTSNSFGQSWPRLVRRAGVRRIPWKVMRKTAAHIVRVELAYGREIADLLLSHTDNGMIRHYAGREWNKLRDATNKMREYLQPVFDAAHDTDVETPDGRGYRDRETEFRSGSGHWSSRSSSNGRAARSTSLGSAPGRVRYSVRRNSSHRPLHASMLMVFPHTRPYT